MDQSVYSTCRLAIPTSGSRNLVVAFSRQGMKIMRKKRPKCPGFILCLPFYHGKSLRGAGYFYGSAMRQINILEVKM